MTALGKVTASMFMSDLPKIKNQYWKEHQKSLLEEQGKLDASQPELIALLQNWQKGMTQWVECSGKEEKKTQATKMEALVQRMPASFHTLVGLFHAMKIMEDAISYQNFFLNEQSRMEYSQIKQPFIRFSQALNERIPLIEKNLQKLITRAEEIILLHAQRGECLEKAASSQTPINYWNEAAEKMTLAIESHLLYAEQVKVGNLAKAAAKTRRIRVNTLFCEAQSSRANALAEAYTLARAQAVQAENQRQADNLGKAVHFANVAGINLAAAARVVISEELSDVYKQAGFYRLDQAKAHAEGNLSQAENLGKAANAAISSAEHFTRAAKGFASFSNAMRRYRLEVAKRYARGDDEGAQQFSFQKYLEEINRKAHQEWYQTRREIERPPVWKGLP
ncbi:MAG: hypothetical protein K2W97_07375 [Chthoniobacterales bacterium]|nr:hypothetical protein [Chthoniobacterales bacterium]